MSDVGFACQTCGLSDVGYQTLSRLYPNNPPRPCYRCNDHFTPASVLARLHDRLDES